MARTRMMRKTIDRHKLYTLGSKAYLDGKPIDDFYNLPESWLKEINRGSWEAGWRNTKDADTKEHGGRRD